MLLYNSFGVLFFIIILIQLRLLALDYLRFKLFRIRHQLFILALNNKLNLNSDLYRSFEYHINASIRFAHRISYVEVLFFSIWFKFKFPNITKTTLFEREMIKANANKHYNEHLKNGLNDLNFEVNKTIFIYLLSISPTFMLRTFFKMLLCILSTIIKIQTLSIENCLMISRLFIPKLIQISKTKLSKIRYQSEKCTI
ncbi:MAG: hypothetical protein ACRCZO_03250 [Cetobacterium sp.]